MPADQLGMTTMCFSSLCLTAREIIFSHLVSRAIFTSALLLFRGSDRKREPSFLFRLPVEFLPRNLSIHHCFGTAVCLDIVDYSDIIARLFSCQS